MFVLVTRVDSIPITPEKFGDDLDTVLRDLIERKYSNKVLAGEGLCICLYEILNIGAILINWTILNLLFNKKFTVVDFTHSP